MHKLPAVAEYLGVSLDTARRYVKSGEIPSTFIGGAYRIKEEDLEAFVESRRSKPGKASSPSREVGSGGRAPFNAQTMHLYGPKSTGVTESEVLATHGEQMLSRWREQLPERIEEGRNQPEVFSAWVDAVFAAGVSYFLQARRTGEWESLPDSMKHAPLDERVDEVWRGLGRFLEEVGKARKDLLPGDPDSVLSRQFYELVNDGAFSEL